MLGISLPEALMIAIIAIIFVGPKELPLLLKNIGKMIGKLKALANEFYSTLEVETEQPKKYIKDLDGNIQPTFDLDDLGNAKTKPKKKK